MPTDRVANPTPPPDLAAPSLVESLDAYLDDIPEAERADALHQVFYGFYTRVAIIDRSTYELSRWAAREVETLEGIPDSLAEAMRDSALFVGQELFAGRIRAMRAMGYVASRLKQLHDRGESPAAYTLTEAVAFDEQAGKLRLYTLAEPGAHPDLPYAPLDYDPRAV